MLYKVLVILHLLGAAVWIGGHVALLCAVLPAAMRDGDPRKILDFEHGYGRVGLIALVIQLATGLWLANTWLGGWANAFDDPTPATHLVIAKIVILAATLALAGHAYHRLLPRLDAGRMRAFAIHAWAITLLAVLQVWAVRAAADARLPLNCREIAK